MNYVLGTGVAAIWIGVLIRIYFAFFATEANIVIPINDSPNKGMNVGIDEDSLGLLLDYDEPFALAMPIVHKVTTAELPENIPTPTIAPITAPIPVPQVIQTFPKVIPSRKNVFKWDILKYKGMVQSEQKIGLIKLNGNSKYVKEKERLDSNLYLIELNSEYMKVKYGDSIKTILIGN